MSVDRKKIIDRVRKCLAIADRTPHEGEMQTALRIAQGMMATHHISMSEIELKEELIVEELGMTKRDFGNWEHVLVSAINIICGTEVLFGDGYKMRGDRSLPRKSFFFVGYVSDVAVAKELFKLVRKVCLAMFNRYNTAEYTPERMSSADRLARALGVDGPSYRVGGVKFIREDYLAGIASRVFERALDAKAKSDFNLSSGDLNKHRALVPVMEKRVKDYINDKYSDLESVEYDTSREIDSKSYHKGYQDGDKVALAKDGLITAKSL